MRINFFITRSFIEDILTVAGEPELIRQCCLTRIVNLVCPNERFGNRNSSEKFPNAQARA
jgi:hypothetical protein